MHSGEKDLDMQQSVGGMDLVRKGSFLALI